MTRRNDRADRKLDPAAVRLRDSLQLKLFVPVFIGLVVLIIVQIQVLANMNRTQYIQTMENRLHDASSDLDRAMVEVMVFGDHDRQRIERLFDEALSLARTPEYGFVAQLVDAAGIRMAGMDDANLPYEGLGAFKPPPTLAPVDLRSRYGIGVALPVINRTTCRRCHAGDGETLGWIAMTVSLEEIQSGTNLIQRAGFLMAVVLSVVFGFTIWALMSIHISRPLSDLQELMGRVMKGDLKVRYKGESQDELAQLGQRFNMMVERLEEIDSELQDATSQLMMRAEKMVNVGELASRLAHEIRNPLAGIESVVAIFMEDLPENDPERPILQETLGQIHRIENTINDLPNFCQT